MFFKDGYVICTSVIPCLSSGLVKNDKMMSMFVLVSQIFGHFQSLAFSRKWGDKPYTRVVEQDVLVNLSKVQQLSNNVSKKCGYFDQSEDKPNGR